MHRPEENHAGEDTPLIQSGRTAPVPVPTRLPRAQIAILLSIWIAESVVSHFIGPFLNQA